MSKGKRIKWDMAWIVDNFDRYPSLLEMTDAYNQAHGTKHIYRTFKGMCQRRGLRKCNLSAEQDQYIRDNYANWGVKKLTAEYNKRFGTSKTQEQIRRLVQNRGLVITDSETYKKLRAVHPTKMQVGECSKGWVEPYVKLGNGKFETAKRYYYRQKHGEIPAGYKIINLDGNVNNLADENLAAVSMHESMLMARNGLYTSNATLTKAGIMYCRLRVKIKNCENYGGQQC